VINPSQKFTFSCLKKVDQKIFYSPNTRKGYSKGERLLPRKLVLSSTVLLVLTLSLVVSVEADSKMWSQTYGGTDADYGRSVVETSDGGYAIAGCTDSFGDRGGVYWLVKTDEFGNMEWNQTYEGTNYDVAHSVIETFDGGYTLAGNSHLVKTDEFGNMEWNQTYGSHSLIGTSDGGYALAGGASSPFDAGSIDFCLVKTDELGNMEWKQTYGGAEDEEAFSLVETSDGGYALAGLTNISKVIGYPKGDFWLVKTDGAGNMEWNKTYETPGGGYAYSVVETSDGGYAIAGEKDRDIWLVKTDASGNMEWNQTYGRTSRDEAFSLVETSDGGYAIAGRTYDSGAETNYVYLIKTDEFGTVEWERTYGGTGTDYGRSVVETSTGGYAIACTTRSFGAGGADVWLIKTDEYGIVPEYSSWLLPTLLLTATLISVIYKKKLINSR
jgi:hypothetical protein